MEVSRPDFGATADDYGRHRAGFPESLFDRLAAAGICTTGRVVVDLGTGTGTMARGFARRGCEVIGLDPKAPMLEVARTLDADAGVHVDHRIGRAERTGLPVASADVVTAGQCWHWFDRAAAAREVARLLRPDGVVVIAHFDWLPLTDNVVEATERLIECHNPSWTFGGGLGVHPRWFRDLGEAGFRDLESFSYDVDESYSHEGWRGRIRASAGVGATLAPPDVERFDDELRELLATRFPEDPLAIPHRVFALTARRPR